MIYLVIVLAIVLVYYVYKTYFSNHISSSSENKIEENEVYKKKLLFNSSEYHLNIDLNTICSKYGYHVYPKVGINDFIEVNKYKVRKDHYKAYQNRINQKHVDFLICNEKYVPVFAIELDGQSHKSKRAYKSDSFKNKLYKSINMKLIRINVPYSFEFIQNIVEKEIENTKEKTQVKS